MREMLRLFLAVLLFSGVSGGLLAGVKTWTQDKIEYQQLLFVKGPAIRDILSGSENDPLNDRFKLKDGDVERTFFVGMFNGERNAVAFETSGKGFGGDIGVMVGINVDTDKLVGIGVTTHSETPGLGSRAKDDPSFSAQFQGMALQDGFQVKSAGGRVDALSGATISSKGVCSAVTKAVDVYRRLKPRIIKKL